MSHSILIVEIECKKNNPSLEPRYRIYIDDILIVERKFWPDAPTYLIQERFTFVDDGQVHSCSLEDLNAADGKTTIYDVSLRDGKDNTYLPNESKFNIIGHNRGHMNFTFLLRER